jgi:hypothetical protein
MIKAESITKKIIIIDHQIVSFLECRLIFQSFLKI